MKARKFSAPKVTKFSRTPRTVPTGARNSLSFKANSKKNSMKLRQGLKMIWNKIISSANVLVVEKLMNKFIRKTRMKLRKMMKLCYHALTKNMLPV